MKEAQYRNREVWNNEWNYSCAEVKCPSEIPGQVAVGAAVPTVRWRIWYEHHYDYVRTRTDD